MSSKFVNLWSVEYLTMLPALSRRTEASGGLLSTRYRHFGFHKMRGFSPRWNSNGKIWQFPSLDVVSTGNQAFHDPLLYMVGPWGILWTQSCTACARAPKSLERQIRRKSLAIWITVKSAAVRNIVSTFRDRFWSIEMRPRGRRVGFRPSAAIKQSAASTSQAVSEGGQFLSWFMEWDSPAGVRSILLKRKRHCFNVVWKYFIFYFLSSWNQMNVLHWLVSHVCGGFNGATLPLYSPVVTICTAQWSLYVPPV